jgi:hypothetical protein
MRGPSTLLRTIRAMTAVITVWCVGCTGFEPLLDAAFGAGASVMTCGSDDAPMGTELSPASTDGSGAQPAVSAAAAEHRGFDCGCGSCQSAAPSVWTFQPAPDVALATVFGRIGMLASIVRAPLLPPPQLTA